MPPLKLIALQHVFALAAWLALLARENGRHEADHIAPIFSVCCLPITHVEMAALKLITLQHVFALAVCPSRTMRWPH
eukprot:11887008-Karenia_brevis.AAC.1